MTDRPADAPPLPPAPDAPTGPHGPPPSAPPAPTGPPVFLDYRYGPTVLVLLVASALYSVALTVVAQMPSPPIPAEAYTRPPHAILGEDLPAEVGGVEVAGVGKIPERAVLAWGAIFSLWGIGFFAFIAFLVYRAVLPEFRARFPLTRAGPRPLPAVLLLDTIAAIALIVALWTVLRPLLFGAWHRAGGTFDFPTLQILALATQFLGYAGGIAAVIWCARRRAGPAGSASLWPFWRTAGLVPPSNFARDLALAAALYALCYWMTLAGTFVNLKIVDALGEQPDQNVLLDILVAELRGPNRTWVLASLTVAAACGAAFFEELLFRGVLYNVLKRHLGTWPAALGGSLIFALVHRVHSQVLPLFILSLLLTYAYERSGRLLPSMVLHALNNSVTLVLLLWTYGG
ncbi:MAG: CPBP family intramembrane metalloprotease [Planctomycetes bacterium]|nr:CPBP family intramembrane metalloprotease [Planctomycetota bacterium]